MIRVDRGEEPLELTNSRSWRLAAAMLHAELHGLPADFDGYDVDPVKTRLWEAQNRKCAYCERSQGVQNQPIEHFRPKGGARHDFDDPGSISKAHYWWLAWTWENLFFACSHCNGAGIKGNHFPIEGAPLAIGDFDIRNEVGLVDPGLMDPLDHIRWIPQRASGDRRHWAWIPVAKSRQGSLTLKVFRWNKDALGVEVTRHLRTVVLPGYQRVYERPDHLRRAEWSELQRNLLTGYAPFQAAAWCALEHWRVSDGAHLPEPHRPGRLRDFAVPTGLPPAPDGTPLRAWCRLLAGVEHDDAFIEICGQSPRSHEALAAILRAASAPEATIRRLKRVLQALVDSERLLLGEDGTYAAPGA